MAPVRPLLRWHGGKWNLAPWIISHFGDHRIYVEPFGGAGSVLLRKPRAYAEIWNDLDGEAVNLFSVMRDPLSAHRLIEMLRFTPFARDEFNAAYGVTDDPVERARRLIIRSFMGHGSGGATGSYRTGFRANSNRSGTTPARDWANLSDCFTLIVDRLQGVIIENRPALRVMETHDGPTTLHFVDPPYLMATRSRSARRRDNGGTYRHELSDDDHAELLEALDALEGMVVLCGYPSELYDARLQNWGRVERLALADGAAPRVEVLWLNGAALAAASRASLFDDAPIPTPRPDVEPALAPAPVEARS